MTLKYWLLGEPPPLKLTPTFFDQLWRMFHVVQDHWTEVALIDQQHFLRIPWVLSKLVSVMDRHYPENKWWYEMHWGTDMQRVSTTKVRYEGIWRDLMQIFRQRGMLP